MDDRHCARGTASGRFFMPAPGEPGVPESPRIYAKYADAALWNRGCQPWLSPAPLDLPASGAGAHLAHLVPVEQAGELARGLHRACVAVADGQRDMGRVERVEREIEAAPGVVDISER